MTKSDMQYIDRALSAAMVALTWLAVSNDITHAKRKGVELFALDSVKKASRLINEMHEKQAGNTGLPF